MHTSKGNVRNVHGYLEDGLPIEYALSTPLYYLQPIAPTWVPMVRIPPALLHLALLSIPVFAYLIARLSWHLLAMRIITHRTFYKAFLRCALKLLEYWLFYTRVNTAST